MNMPKFKVIQPYRTFVEQLDLVHQDESIRQSLLRKAFVEMREHEPVRIEEMETGILRVIDARGKAIRVAPDNKVAVTLLWQVFPDVLRKWVVSREDEQVIKREKWMKDEEW